jgi:hypothetical protein
LFSVWLSLVVFAAAGAAARTPPPIDIDALPAIAELPDPFLRDNGQRIRTSAEWKAQRKMLLDKVLRYEYGALPPSARNVSGRELSSHPIEGLSADEKVIELSMGPGSSVHTHLTLTLPRGAGPFPVIVCGDYIAGDKSWKKVDPAIVEMVVKRGYALAEFDRVEIAPDSAVRTGVYAAYPEYEGGRPAAWAWGYHRVIDYLLAQPYTDPKRIVVTGHSRGGKAVLLAGATDERIAVTAPNNSGCGGAGCFRYQAPNSEDIPAILKNFPFWFQPEFGKFIGHIDRLPIDQHTVRALVAPRALLSTEGLEDLWANPEGTQMSYLAAREVYDFLGVPDRIGIAYRPGGHAHGMTDWTALLDFSDWQLFGKQPGRSFHDLPFPNAPRPFSWHAPATHSVSLPGKTSDYHGFERHDFAVDACEAIVVAPRRAAQGAPWIWRAEFFDHRPEADLALLERGYHLAYIQVGNTFGCPSAMRHWDAFYRELTDNYGLSKRPVLEGLSRGGLYVYNWAAANPSKVAAIYGDNPVCDFKSWPGGKGKGPGSPDDWKKLIKDYGFHSEAEAIAYTKNPIDNLKPLARAHIPLIHVCGDADEFVPYPENTVVLRERYEKLGGTIQVIVKPGFHHHPHGLDDPTPVVEFLERAVNHGPQGSR